MKKIDPQQKLFENSVKKYIASAISFDAKVRPDETGVASYNMIINVANRTTNKSVNILIPLTAADVAKKERFHDHLQRGVAKVFDRLFDYTDKYFSMRKSFKKRLMFLFFGE